MFVRKKKNKSGLVSVQVIDKSSGKYKMLKTVGSSSDPDEIEQLLSKGRDWIQSKNSQLNIDFTNEQHLAEQVSVSLGGCTAGIPVFGQVA